MGPGTVGKSSLPIGGFSFLVGSPLMGKMSLISRRRSGVYGVIHAGVRVCRQLVRPPSLALLDLQPAPGTKPERTTRAGSNRSILVALWVGRRFHSTQPDNIGCPRREAARHRLWEVPQDATAAAVITTSPCIVLVLQYESMLDRIPQMERGVSERGST